MKKKKILLGRCALVEKISAQVDIANVGEVGKSVESSANV